MTVAPDEATQVPILLNTMHVWREAVRRVVDYVIRTRSVATGVLNVLSVVLRGIGT